MKRKKLIQRKRTVNPEGNGVSEHNERLYKSLTRNLHAKHGVNTYYDANMIGLMSVLGLFVALIIKML